MDEIVIRKAKIDDVKAINKIKNYYIEETELNLKHNAISIEEDIEWFNNHNKNDRHIIEVAITKDRVVGWASLSPFRNVIGYADTVELSIVSAQ